MRSSTYQVCDDCVECSADGCDVVAFCRSEPGWERRQALCEDHWELPAYDPDTDPTYIPTGIEDETTQEHRRRWWADLERRKAESGFDPVTNSNASYYEPKDTA